jgi:NADH-quinone oxidoreductase subunit M
VGEFLMFNALYQYNVWAAVFAGIGIILAAVYTLGMVQKVFYGKGNAVSESFTDIGINEKVALSILVLFILVMGFYSGPLLRLGNDHFTGFIK